MRRLVLLFLVLGVAGCVTLRSEHALTGTPRDPYTGAVSIVMEGALVPGAYEEIAIVSATGGGGDASLPAVLGALQGEAAGLGCDAVIHVRYDRGVNSATATGVGVRRGEAPR
jgi:hypothetical protein